MDNICPECKLLMTGKQKNSHICLSLISTLPNSQLYKCTACQTYLHCFDQQWEVLIEGYYNKLTNALASSELKSTAM